MKNLILIVAVVLRQVVIAQSTFYNAGNVEIHNEGQIGFHIDLRNDGSFTSKKGLAGFYSNDNTLYVYGENKVAFRNMEVAVEENLQLLVSAEVSNSINFINGKVVTPRGDKNVTLSFDNDAVCTGENNKEYVDGYAAVNSDLEFTFPIGDDDRLRPASIQNNIASQKFKAAYFYEDANYTTTLNKTFNTENKQDNILEISNEEFWDIDGQAPVNVTLTWDEYSNVANMTNNIKSLVVVGWSKIDREWKNLGKVEVTGDLYTGTVKSSTIFPDDYEVLTIATELDSKTNNLDKSTVVETRLFDMTRRLVKTFGADEPVNFTGIAKGVYITDVYLSNGKNYAKKVVNR